jgi:hypothetical protein
MVLIGALDQTFFVEMSVNGIIEFSLKLLTPAVELEVKEN